MDARAPAVVAVLVTRDPGPWFEEVLEALAAQDYEELSVLVLVSGGSVDPTQRVARVLPDAFVRRLKDDRGFGAAANQALEMVDGAAFFLLCHDDCAPNPDAVHVLVEESYRSNAGIVSPKMVRWDDASILLHVGMSADKTGAMVERLQVGEVDHGQHDAVRDVFVAPGGFTLIRADLFKELGGYDDGIVAMGEDLDLSWRVQVAGARVVVAPDASVRHLQAAAGGLRAVAGPTDGSTPPSLQVLQRRHELRAVFKCYGIFHLLRVVPQALLLATGEGLVALFARDQARALAVAGAWRWNLSQLTEIRRHRVLLRAHRRFPDKEVRRLQLRGSARLTTYLSRLTHQGFDVAHGLTPATEEGAMTLGSSGDDQVVLTGSVGTAFSEDSDFDELDDLGHRAGRDRFGRRRRRPALSSRRSRLALWMGVAILLLFGTRQLFTGPLPLLGQFLPLGSWGTTWHHFVSGWQPAGVGTTAPATPAFAVLGTVGTVLLGGMGLTQKLAVLGCIPLGAWGVMRLVRPLTSSRARLAAGVSYLGLPLAYNALALGRWDGLVAYALVPWMLSRLARSTGLAPFADAPGGPTGWRASLPGQMVTLGIIVALAIAFAPAVLPVLLLCAVGVVAGSYIVGQAGGAWRALAVAGGAGVFGAVLCAPWVIGTLLAGRHWVGVFGLPGSSASAPGWGQVLRFAVGPVGQSPLSWLLVVAAFLPLLIGRRERLAWAARLWVVAALCWFLALAVGRGWTGAFAPGLDVVLVPAAVGVAACIGLGVSAFENDLSGYRFGWRQAVAGLTVLATILGVFPVVAKSVDGQWGLAPSGYRESLGFMSRTAGGAPFRVLWLGDPRALPLGGWSINPGLAYSTSESGIPNAANLWAPAGPGPASDLAASVQAAVEGQTSHLGRLLAPAAVRYVVVVRSIAPVSEGFGPEIFAPPADLVGTLLDQGDLQSVPVGGGISVFENIEYVPERAQRAGGAVETTHRAPSRADVGGWHPVLPGPAGALSYGGAVARGTLLASYAPAGRWQLTSAGRPQVTRPAFGWAAQYPGVPAGPATLRFKGTPLLPLAIFLEALAWLGLAGVLLGRRRLLDWWWGPLQAARRSPPPDPPPAPPPVPRHAANPKVDA